MASSGIGPILAEGFFFHDGVKTSKDCSLRETGFLQGGTVQTRCRSHSAPALAASVASPLRSKSAPVLGQAAFRLKTSRRRVSFRVLLCLHLGSDFQVCCAFLASDDFRASCWGRFSFLLCLPRFGVSSSGQGFVFRVCYVFLALMPACFAVRHIWSSKGVSGHTQREHVLRP